MARPASRRSARTATAAPTRSAFGYSTNEPGYVDLTVHDAAGAVVRAFPTRVSSGPGRVSWDGLDDADHVVRNGVYTVSLAPRDYAANEGVARDSTVAVYKSLSHVASLKTVFFPQDLDKYARTARFSFDLSVSATVSGVLRNEAGDAVLTMFDALPLAPGSHLFDWDGRLTDGSMAPRGTYTAAISATDGVLSASGLAAVVADGFRITVNDSTPAAARRSSCTPPQRSCSGRCPGSRSASPGRAPSA